MRGFIAIVILIITLIGAPAYAKASAGTQITAVSWTDNQITLSLSQKPRYTVFMLDNPHRVVIDLANTRLSAKSGGLRAGKKSDNGLRLVADLEKATKFSHGISKVGNKWEIVVMLGKKIPPSSPFAKGETNPPPRSREAAPSTFAKATADTQRGNSTFRPPSKSKPKPIIVSDEETETETDEVVFPSKPKIISKSKSTPIIVPEDEAEALEEDVLHDGIFPDRDKQKFSNRYLAKRDVIIVIDAGHGGKDPGAVGSNGAREKDVTLAIARQLHFLLNKEPGIRAILTRPNDTFIRLRDRLRVARKHKADVFVSIHADAFKTPQASGASVFALSPSGASSEAARWLAEKENVSELGDIKMDDKGAALRSVLLDLSQTATISLSVQLGSHVLNQIGKVAKVHHTTIEQARFVVLKSPDIPSILVETGFISNAQEARLLADPVHQNRIALALKTGLHKHFVQYPPPGTLVALARNK